MTTLNCLIVGETPTTQLISWRLSLTNAFIILVSKYLSSDGLISWKSSRIGSNFYTPNIFAKDLKNLKEKILNSNNRELKYQIDILIVSCVSFDQFIEYTNLLCKFINNNTIIILDGNFGIELEKLVIKTFYSHHPNVTILSILCDAEIRLLSSGSYCLISDSYELFFGITYMTDENDNDEVSILLKKNKEKVVQLFKGNTKFYTFIQVLKRENVSKSILYSPADGQGNEMALTIWKYIIPRISLNILTIIFEEFDYDKLISSHYSLLMFKNLTAELFSVCLSQCKGIIPEFTNTHTNFCGDIQKIDRFINHKNIINIAKERKRYMDQFAVNEYPEFLTLTFEAYCFYHRLEYPSLVLLYQPIKLAIQHKLNYSGLNFLFVFYSKLLSLTGIKIEGDNIPTDYEKPTLLFGGKLNMNHMLINNSHQECNKLKSFTTSEPSNISHQTSPTEEFDIPLELQKIYLGASEKTEFSSPSPREKVSSPNSVFLFNQDQSNIGDSDDNDDHKSNHKSKKKLTYTSTEFISNKNRWSYEDYEDSIIDEKEISLPTFSKSKLSLTLTHESIDAAQNQTVVKSSRVYSDNLEQQLRSNLFYMSRYYRDEYQIDNTHKSDSSLNKLWKLQRKHHIQMGKIFRPIVSPNDLLLKHLGILTKANMGGILHITTSRYGTVDSSEKIYQDWKRDNFHVNKLCIEYK